MSMNETELKEILKQHKLWFSSKRKEGKRADLKLADLEEAILYGANLQEANLQKAYLQEANLRGANLRGAGLQEANLREANLREAILHGAILQGADLRRANLQKADLRRADLRWADLRRANLRRANLRGANLQRADLQGANLLGADLRGAKLQEAKNIKDAILSKEQLKYFGLGVGVEDKKNLQQQAEKNVRSKNKIKELEEKLKTELENKSTNKKETKEAKKTKEELEKLKNIEAENKAIKEELKELKKEELKGQDTSLDGVINKISTSTPTSKDLLKTYKTQSKFLSTTAIILYFIAICVGWKNYPNIGTAIEIKNWYIFAPTLLLSFIATALLRHDWKVRQLSIDLIAHQNITETATGILKASLALQQIDGMGDDILKDSFDDMRTALLFGAKENKKDNIKDEKSLENTMGQIVAKSIK